MADDETNRLFAAVDALLEHATPLPPPAERKRLREAHGLTQQQVADTLGVRRATVADWESDNPKRQAAPRPPERDAYARLLAKLAELYPPATTEGGPAAPETSAAAPALAAAGSPSPADSATPSAPPLPPPLPPPPPPPPPPSTSTTPSAPRRQRATRQTARGSAPSAGEGSRFPAGPLAVLDGDGTAYLADGRTLDCAVGSVVELVPWALEAGLGAERLHRWGQDADPLVLLTESAAERFGLPPRLQDRRIDGGLRLADDHPVVREILAAGWKLTRRGFGPWPRIHRPAESGRRRCVQLAVLGWDALEERAWPGADQLPPDQLAAMLGTYAIRVLTPRGSTAVNGLELMTSVRPPTKPVRTADGWKSGPVPTSLTEPVDPAPPEAPDEHPVAHDRPEGQALDEEAYEWVRPAGLTDAECELPYVIGLDVNMAFAAAANRLTVRLGAPVHTDGPVFDKTIPGCWYVDLSHVDLSRVNVGKERRQLEGALLPSPFTPSGERPTGPAWYATPTVAYAAELGYDVTPLQAWLPGPRYDADGGELPMTGPYLDPWYERLRDAYLATMADLGVTTELSEAEYLQAMAGHKQVDPAAAAVLDAIKATVKGGIGKLRERAQGGRAKFRSGQRWPALERPAWRPDIRAAVIATARVNMHRKMLKMAANGLYPIAILSDCVVYPSRTASPLELLPRTPEGKPAPGIFRLGVSPGMVKLEGTRELWWAAEIMEQNFNPARYIKDDPTRDGEE